MAGCQNRVPTITIHILTGTGLERRCSADVPYWPSRLWRAYFQFEIRKSCSFVGLDDLFSIFTILLTLSFSVGSVTYLVLYVLGNLHPRIAKNRGVHFLLGAEQP